ncbi:MAG: hypothetical protein ACRDZ4_09620 [Egibacteraceae bacterium]
MTGAFIGRRSAGSLESMSKKNHVAEWYGHRVYPVVAANPEALADQQSRRCPFLSDARGQPANASRPQPRRACAP